MEITKPLGRSKRRLTVKSRPSLFEGGLEQYVRAASPTQPIYIFFPDVIQRAARRFVQAFPGKPLYAVKTNPDPNVIRAVIAGGIRAFDVASIEEIRLVRSVDSTAELHFMHTVKAPEAIREAYFQHGVRHFVLDHEDELFKIIRETELAQDLCLTVRIALPKNDSALIDFSGKFGATRRDAIDLLKKCRPVARDLGISFHVGTQTMDAGSYAQAVSHAAEIIRNCGVTVDILNAGGGFPVTYADGEAACTVRACVRALQAALEREGLSALRLLAEPGRVLVAEGGALVARVELRKGDVLYLNDGVYGGLFDAAKWVGTRFPVRAVSCDRPFTAREKAFRLAGPTCDSLDMMEGPFILPADIDMGDWVVFENAGAYSISMRSNFNGFGAADTVLLGAQK